MAIPATASAMPRPSNARVSALQTARRIGRFAVRRRTRALRDSDIQALNSVCAPVAGGCGYGRVGAVSSTPAGWVANGYSVSELLVGATLGGARGGSVSAPLEGRRRFRFRSSTTTSRIATIKSGKNGQGRHQLHSTIQATMAAAAIAIPN